VSGGRNTPPDLVTISLALQGAASAASRPSASSTAPPAQADDVDSLLLEQVRLLEGQVAAVQEQLQLVSALVQTRFDANGANRSPLVRERPPSPAPTVPTNPTAMPSLAESTGAGVGGLSTPHPPVRSRPSPIGEKKFEFPRSPAEEKKEIKPVPQGEEEEEEEEDPDTIRRRRVLRFSSPGAAQ